MVVKYRLVRESINRVAHLEDEVNRLLESGWQPVGSINVVVADKQTILIQHMEKGTRDGSTR